MNQNQSIIVYHNPLQQAFWESDMLIPLLGGLGSGFLLFVVLMWIAGKVSGDWRGPNNTATGSAAVASIVAGVLVFKWLML